MKTSLLVILILSFTPLFSQINIQNLKNNREILDTRIKYSPNQFQQFTDSVVSTSVFSNVPKVVLNKTFFDNDFVLAEKIRQFWVTCPPKSAPI